MASPNYNNILDKNNFLNRDNNLFVLINLFRLSNNKCLKKKDVTCILDKVTVSVLTNMQHAFKYLFVLINFFK